MKTAVVRAKGRETTRVAAKFGQSTHKETLQGSVKKTTASRATVYTDDATAYETLQCDHAEVKHSLGDFVKGDANAIGIESLWSVLRRAHKGTVLRHSPKRLNRYVQEFAGRHNVRHQDTIDHLVALAHSMKYKRLAYKQLIAGNGMASGIRATYNGCARPAST